MMPSLLLSHPSRDENKGDMLLMIPHLQLKLPDDVNKDNDSICNKNDDDDIGCKVTVFQTSLNVTKICMGTITLELLFESKVGGLLVFNVIVLFVIGVWNYYSANCLLRCLEYLPEVNDVVNEVTIVGGGGQ